MAAAATGPVASIGVNSSYLEMEWVMSFLIILRDLAVNSYLAMSLAHGTGLLYVTPRPSILTLASCYTRIYFRWADH